MTPLWLILGLGSFASGAVLAVHHPLWPMAMLLAFFACFAVVAWRPGIWLFVVPASLPFLNFSPWTGWLIFEEFDLLLLGVAAGAYCRRARDAGKGVGAVAELSGQKGGLSQGAIWLLVLLLGFGTLSLYRGFADAGGFSFGWFDSYEDPLNSLRVFKSLLWALLLQPLLLQEIQSSSQGASRRLASGVVAGLAGVILAVLWERAAFPGVLDFSSRYRTTALFWEMHVGGAAIDSYLAMAVPFVVWALRMARTPMQWVAAAALTLLTGYACLTTFSRGLYLAVAAPLALLGVLLWLQQKGGESGKIHPRSGLRWRFAGWRAKAGLALAVALAGEVLLVLGGGTFMMERMDGSDRDLRGRIGHWQHGLQLLKTPSEWLFGKGLGRLPADYARSVPQGEFPGQVRWLEERGSQTSSGRVVRVTGPKSLAALGGLYGLTQRVNAVAGARYYVSLDARVREATQIYLEVCERHLLYERACQASLVNIEPGNTTWQRLRVPLRGASVSTGEWYAPRSAVFFLSVVSPGGVADFDNVSLTVSGPRELLANGDFSEGLVHWLTISQYYFLPWHIDNLLLEWLIERGVVGLLLHLALMMYAMWRLVLSPVGGGTLSPYLMASLCAVLLEGVVSSLMDVPRVAFLLYFLSLYAILSAPDSRQAEAGP